MFKEKDSKDKEAAELKRQLNCVNEELARRDRCIKALTDLNRDR